MTPLTRVAGQAGLRTGVGSAPVGAEHQPVWPDAEQADRVGRRLRRLPEVVRPDECEALTVGLAAAGRGEAFVLQSGDCAESLRARPDAELRLGYESLVHAAHVLSFGSGTPTVLVARIAGQFAKPRSAPTETVDGVTLPTYLGDAVNGAAFTARARALDPFRMLEAYHAASGTTRGLRRLAEEGVCPTRLRRLNDQLVLDQPSRSGTIGHALGQAYGFQASQHPSDPQAAVYRVPVYTSHEMLLLDYERALVRDSGTGGRYGSSGHLLWIGERTRALAGSHVDLASRLENPVAVKLGPTSSPDQVVDLVRRLNPGNRAGRLSLITRMGAERLTQVLPGLVQAVQRAGVPVTWLCDPMHANTVRAAGGLKTRRFVDVVDEVDAFLDVHAAMGSWPGGLHLEATGDDVTECLGGPQRLTEQDLATRYRSLCDPRLNRRQTLSLVHHVAARLGHGRVSRLAG